MPLVTRFFIRTSFVCLALALFAALLLALRSSVAMPDVLAALSPVYFHLFMVGWVTQLIFGVAYWMFPKYSREKPRGSALLAWLCFAGLNGGLLLRVIAEPLNATQSSPLWDWSLLLSALLQWFAGLLFVVNTWSRVKER